MRIKGILSFLIVLFYAFPMQAQTHRLDSLKKVLHKTVDVNTKFHIYLGMVEEIMKHDKDSRDIAIYFTIAEKITLNQLKGLQKADGFYELGNSSVKMENYSKAIPFYQQAFILFENLDQPKTMMVLHKDIGRAYYLRGQYAIALEHYLKGMEISKKYGFEGAQLGWLYRYAGSVFKRQGVYKQALHYYKQAKNIFNEVDDSYGLTSAYHNIGVIYGNIGDTVQQMEYYEKALKLATDNQYLDRVILTSGYIGRVYLDKGDYNLSLVYFHKAYEIALKMDDPSAIPGCLINFGSVYLMLSEFSKALDYFNKAHTAILNTQKYQQIRLLRLYQWYSKLYSKLGNYKEAYRYSLLQEAMHDSIWNASIVTQINELEAIQVLRKREHKITQLNFEKKLANERLKYQRNWLIFMGVGIVVALVFVILIGLQKRALKQANQILVKKNMEVVESEQKNTFLKKEKPNSADSLLSDSKKEALFSQIIHAMEVEKIYCQEDTTLVSFAQLLDTNTTYVSHIINEQLSRNFTTFINEYRIKEARRILADSTNHRFTIEAIAQKVGFKSKSAFNNAFKKYTGITPSFYMKTIGEQLDNITT